MSSIMILANQDSVLFNFRKEVIKEIIYNGYDVIISSPYGKKIEYFKKLKCKFIDTYINRRGINPFEDYKLFLTYLKIIKRYKPDIVLTYTSKCAIYGGMACRLTKTPYIVNNSGLIVLPKKLNFLKFFISFLYKLGDSKSNCMMYQNEYEMQIINNILKHRVKYKLIPGSGVNLDEFKYREYPDEKYGIIFNYVARIMKGKGIEEYLKCAKIVHKKYPNTVFNIFGIYEDETYKSIIEKYELEGIVKYMGVYDDLRPFIEKAHAIIHPSYSEGMTNVCLEHSAMGRVCIASDIPGCREIIEDDRTGYVFQLKHVDKLVEKIEKFINLSNNEKKKMGQLARSKMEKEFSRKFIGNTYINEINKILK